MNAVFSPWLRRRSSASVRPSKRRPFRRADASRLWLETLEDRTLLTAWSDIATTFNNGVLTAGTRTTSLAGSAFDVSIPLVRSSVPQAVDLPGKFATPFGLQLTPNEPNLETIRQGLRNQGFTVEYLDVIANDNGDLLRLSKDFTFGGSQASFSVGGIGGDLGFKYFDDHVAGGLNISTLTATVQPIKLHVTFGVDLVGGVPTLFLQDSTPDAQGKFTGLEAFTVTGQTHVTGTMNLRNLLNVQIAGDAILSLSADLSFKSPDTTSHKLRLTDLNATNIVGTLNGSARFANVQLSTQIPILPALKWTGNFIANIVTDALGHKTVTPSETTVTPDVWGTLKGFVTGLLNITPSLDFLKPLSSALDFKIPLFNFTLGDKLGVGGVSAITKLAADVSTINNDIQYVEDKVLNPIGIFVGIPPGGDPARQPRNLLDLGTLIYHVIQGDNVDLLSFSKKGGNRWGQQFCFTFLSLGVPGVADVHLDACFGGYVGWDYSVGFGIDTTGFYIDPSTHIGVSGGIFAGLHGGLRVLGFDLASADGRISLDAGANLSIRNPDPSQGSRIYLDEIFNGGNVFQSLLNALQVNFTIDVNAHVEAKLNLAFFTLTLFSHDWNLGRLVDIHLATVTTQSKRAIKLNLQDQGLRQDPAVSFNNGVLTLDGRSATADNPNLVLLSGKDGTVTANWQGHGIDTFTGVRQVKFLGGRGNDRVQVKPGFNVPIYAQGGSGSNYFEAGDGDSTLLGGGSAGNRGATLMGGAGHDWLQGGPGDDQILGGSGDSTLIGGAGSDLLRAGTGNDLLLGGVPLDPAHPERGGDPNDPDTAGSDTLDGGLGNSTLWAGNGPDTLVAGYGTDQLHGGKGDDLIIAGATVDPTATPPVVNGGGDDTIWAGAGNNSIRGGQGNDTIYGAPQGTFTVGSDGHLSFTTSVTSRNTIQGGTGNDLIYGAPGNDLLIAGTGNDRLYSDSDASHKTTLVAGPGEDWLYAGTGDDLLRLPFGVNTGGVRSHFVGGSGHDILAVTTDATNHVIRLTQSSATNFTATSYADVGETQQLGSFNFEVPSDLHGNFIQTLALEAISGNNKLDVAPEVRKNVELKGGTGNDTLIGGGGINTLIGGTGNDLLQGGPGTNPGTYNEFHGGTGSTTMVGGAGADIFYGGTGDNDMRGGNGRVVMYGGKSLPGQRNHDSMSVGSANLMVVMIAGANDVTMYGGPGRNVLLGGAGSAEMHAGDGDSVLTASTGPVTMYGGAGYDVLIGGRAANVLHANDPTRTPPNHSTVDWQTRFDELHDQIAATRAEEDRLTALINNPNTPPDQIPELQAEKTRVIQEDGQIALAIYQLDIHYAPHNQDSNPMTRYYDNPNVLMGGDGPTVIYGSTFPNYIIAGNGRTTIYSGGADDTVTGTAGKDTFFIPPLPDNATVVFTAQDDGHGNQIPVITVDAGAVHQVEKVHSRGITQIGVVAGAGTNTIRVNLGAYALYDIAVQCTSGNDRIDLTGFQGGATVQAGSGTDTVVGGSPTRGVELDGGSGLSVYEVSGNGAWVQAESYYDPQLQRYVPFLAVYRDGWPRREVMITKTTFRRLSIQGLAGTQRITIGPLGSFSFPEVIASAGLGNKTIDASAVNQRVSLLGGAGSDTLIGGSGTNYFQGGTGETLVQNYRPGDTVKGGGGSIRYEAKDTFEEYPGAIPPAGWSSRLVNSVPGDTFGTYVVGNGPYGNYLYGWQTCRDLGQSETINLFTGMGAYNPASQGPIASVDLDFDFKTIDASVYTDFNFLIAFVIRQGTYDFISYIGATPWKHEEYWRHVAISQKDSSDFYPNAQQPGAPPHPDFSASGAPLSFGFLAAIYIANFTGYWGADNFHVAIRSAPPAAATSFRVTPSASSATAGTPISYTVTALDVAGNTLPSYRATVHVTNNDPAFPLSFDYTFNAADNGVHTFTNVTWKTAGPRTFSVVQPDAPFVSGMATVNVLPGAADHLQALMPEPVSAGSTYPLQVTAFDHYGNVVTGYRGTVHFSSTDSQANRPGDYTFTAADNGVHTFMVTLKTAGSQSITVHDTVDRNVADFTRTVSVTPAAAISFRVQPPATSVPAGSIFTVTVTALDAYGNVATGYRGTIHPPLSDGQTIAPPDYTFTATDNGTHIFSLALTQAYYRTVTIADTNHLTGSALVRINPLVAVSLVLRTAQGTAGAGTAIRSTITAQDKYGNIATGYTGTVHFASSDPQATLPADSAFTAADNGTKSFTVTFRTAGLQTLLIADTVNPLLRGLVSDTIAALPATLQVNLPPVNAQPIGIVAGPDGNFWFLESNVNKIGRVTPTGVITEFSVSFANHGLGDMTVGPDGNLWFTERVTHSVGRINPRAGTDAQIQASVAQVVSSGSLNPWLITAGTDGNLWFTENGSQLARLTPQGVLKEFALSVYDYAITSGPDGNLWLTGYTSGGSGLIGRLNPRAGTDAQVLQSFQTFALPAASTGVYSILSGPDGNLWYTSRGANAIGRMSPAGMVLSETRLSQGTDPFGLTSGPDGSVWFLTDAGTTEIGQINPAGALAEFPLDKGPSLVTVDAAGNLWVTLQTGNQVVRLTPQVTPPQVTVTPAAAASFGLTAAANPVTAGTALTVTATAYDAFGNVATGYRGTVHFTSSNAQETLPADYTFQPTDNGVHVFTLSLTRAGSQTLTLTDTVNNVLTSRGLVATETALSSGSVPYGITYDARDGNFWATEHGGNVIARITPAGVVTKFAVLPAGVIADDIYAAPDGTLWFNQSNNQLGRLNPLTQDYQQYPIPAEFGGLTIGPDGNLWFAGTDNKIYQVNPANGTVLHAYPLPTGSSAARGFTAGPDGNLWFVEPAANKIGRITTAGVITEFAIPTAGSLPYGITAGPDGNVWFGEGWANKVGRVNLSHTPIDITEFALPTPGNFATWIATGPDGNLWFEEWVAGSNTGRIGRMTPAGVVTEFATPSTSYVHRLTVGPDGSVWFTEGAVDKVARLAPAMTVLPATAASLTVTGLPASLTAGTSATLTITLKDAYGNVATGYRGTVHFSSRDPQAVLPPDHAFSAADNGTYTVTVTLKTAGPQTVTAQDNFTAGLTGNQTATVQADVAKRLVLAGVPATVQAGTALTLTVTALDNYGNTATGYTGTVSFSSTDPQAMLPADYPFTAADNGVHTFTGPYHLATAGFRTIIVLDPRTPALNTSATAQVTPGDAVRFVVTTSADAGGTVAGMAFDVTVRAQDAYGNTATGYTGTIHFASQDPYGASLPANTTFQPSDMGTVTLRGAATLYTAGAQDVTATDTASGITGQDLVGVSPAALDHFLVTTSVDGGSTTAGVAFNVTVTAQDLYGNTVMGYTGTVTFTSADPYGATLSADYPFQAGDQGMATFVQGATLYTAGTWDVTVTDTATGQAGSANVTVTPAAASQFVIAAPATAAPRMPFDVTVTALDPYGNVDVNYRGTVTFASSDADPGVVLPGDYTFRDTDNGVAVFPQGFALVTLGDQTITVTDTSSGITGMATVTVQQAPSPGAASLGGKRSAARVGESVSPTQPAVRADVDRVEVTPSLQRLISPGTTDAADSPLGLGWLAAARPHRAPLGLVETLDQLFMEEGLID